MAGFAVLLGLLIAVVLPLAAIYLTCRWLFAKWVEAGRDRPARRAAILSTGVLTVLSPYLLFKAYDLYFLLSRVPAPLNALWVEYRLEKSWGIGLPGDNETGFVVYRLTGGSADWARKQGSGLGAALFPNKGAQWHPTPVNDDDPNRGWHGNHSDKQSNAGRPTILKYLDQYGFSIPVEKGRDAEANDAIQHPGSFYSYGRGGSVTIVDPKRGKVYFAYAG